MFKLTFSLPIPYPLESKFSPTLMVSHGFLSFKYSFTDDSRRNAYFPFELSTFNLPCWLSLTNTELLSILF